MKLFSGIFLFFFLFQNYSFAQNSGTISGTIKDKNERLEFATVTLAKSSDTSKVVKFQISDSLGRFKFENIAYDTYLVKCSMVGYTTFSKKINLTSNNEQFIVILAENINLLQGVSVVAQKKLVEKTEVGFIVNASANITQAGGTATDLMKNIPTVNVDDDGGITLRGKAPLILINGRNSNLSNPNLIPASSIESIEIISNTSAKYDANAESGIINIKLKKNKQDGTNGSVALGSGYGAKGRLSGSAIINHKTQKFNFGLGYDNRFSGRTRELTGSRTNFNIDDNHLFNQNRYDSRIEQLQNLKLNIDFNPNDKNSFAFEAIGNTEGQDNLETLFTKILTKTNAFVSNTKRYSKEIARGKVGEFALDYSRKFSDDRKSLTANISTSINNDKENTDIVSQAIADNDILTGSPFLERTHNYENGNVSNAKVDYAFEFSKKTILETGYKGIFRGINANFESGKFVNDVFNINTGASNIFNFKENIQAFYALFSSVFGSEKTSKWKYNVGLRAENVHNDGSTINQSVKFNNDYLKLFPSGSLTFNKAENEFLKFSYGKRINRPGLGALNPFIDITDALNPHSGNPDLKPEIIHALEIGYNKEYEIATFSTNLFYRYAKNTIRQFYIPQGNGVILNKPINIGNATTYGLENVFTLKPSAKYDLNASLALFQQHLDGSNITPDAVQNAFGWNGKLINNIIPFKNGKLQVIGNYNSALATPQGKRLEQYYVDLGYQQKLGKGNVRLGLTVVDVFNSLKSGYSNTTVDFSNIRTSKADTRAVMLTFAYTFKTAFKEKLLDNQFSKEY
jgi:outer membrane receptor protein involved in Fe transport